MRAKAVSFLIVGWFVLAFVGACRDDGGSSDENDAGDPGEQDAGDSGESSGARAGRGGSGGAPKGGEGTPAIAGTFATGNGGSGGTAVLEAGTAGTGTGAIAGASSTTQGGAAGDPGNVEGGKGQALEGGQGGGHTGGASGGAGPDGASGAGACVDEEDSTCTSDSTALVCSLGVFERIDCPEACAANGFESGRCNNGGCECSGALDDHCALGAASLCGCFTSDTEGLCDEDWVLSALYMACYRREEPDFEAYGNWGSCFADFASMGSDVIDCAAADVACPDPESVP